MFQCPKRTFPLFCNKKQAQPQANTSGTLQVLRTVGSYMDHVSFMIIASFLVSKLT